MKSQNLPTSTKTSDQSVQEIKQRSVHGAFSYFVRTALLQAIGLVSLIILSSLFRPEDFGIYGFVLMIIGLLTFVSDIGFAAALIQKKSEPTITDYRTVFTTQFLLSLVIVAVALAIVYFDLITERTGSAGNWVLLALAVSFPLATLKTIPSVLLERKLDFSKLVYPQIVEQITFNGILIYLAWSGWDATAYAVAVMSRTLIGVILMNILQQWPIGIALSKDSLMTLLKFGALFQVNDLLARIKDQLFYVVLGFVLPIREYGYIQWAKNWSMYPYTLTVQNVMAVTFPAFSRLQDNKQALRKGIEVSIFWITVAIFPILVGMAFFIYPLLNVFADHFGKWLPAVPSFALFSLSIAWSAIATPLTNLLSATGKINRSLALMIMWTTLTWTITPLFLWRFGFNGVALAAFVISFSSIAAVWMVKRELPLALWPVTRNQLAAAVVMAVFILLGYSLWQQHWMWLVSGMVASMLVYVVVLLVLAKNQLWEFYHAIRR